jgi:hypothetical protein
VNRVTAYDVREKDPEFAALWEEALEIATARMEAEARRRAVRGTLKPVFYEGSVCGHIREYSDTLMIFLLKAHKPGMYRDNKVVVTGDPSNPLKHEHSGTVTVTDRIERLADAFAGAADRAGEGPIPNNGS